MNVFEIFGTVGLKGAGDVENSLTKLEKRAQKVQKGMRVVGLAFTAVGAAGLALVASTKKINAQLGVTAMTLGATTKELRALTLATTNVTFPIEEVTATFDLLARAGVKDQKILQAVATSFDTLGDAIGMPASQVTAKLIPAMKTFNLNATQMAGKTDKLTYLFRNTTVSLDDFNRMVGYVTPDLVKMGLTTEDMIAILAELEEQGYSGEVMTREFRKAVNLATKEQIPLNEALGISTETMEKYAKELEGTTGLTDEYAAEANKQFTIMDKLKQKWSELTLKASGFLEPLEPILSGMTALGPLMIALSTSAGTAAVKWALHTAALVAHKVAMVASAIAIHAVTAAQWLWNIAMTANPIGLIIAGITALIAIGILLWKNWDKVVEFFKGAWEALKNGFQSVRDFFVKIWANLVDIFRNNWQTILAILMPFIGIPLLIFKHWETIKEFFVQLWANVTDTLVSAWDGILNFFKSIPEKIGQAFKAIKDIILAPFRAAWGLIEKGINGLISMLNKIHIKIPSWIPIIGGKEFGVNIKPVTLPKFAQGTMLTEPTLLSSLRTGAPIGIAGETGPERLLGVAQTRAQGETNVTNNFNGPWFIREEADIQKIARELFHLQRGKTRAQGGSLP